MKRVNKVYCLVLALVAASALAAPFIFHHDVGPANSEAALQLDVSSRANNLGATADVGASHIGSDGPPTLAASFAEIERFSFRPVMGDIDDSHAAPDGTLLNVGNLPFPAGAAGSSGSAQSYANGGSGGSASGVPGAPGGLNGSGMAFNLPFGSTPLRDGTVQSAPESAAYLPLSLPGSGAGSSDGAGNNGGNANANAGNAPDGLDGAGGTPSNTEGVFNPSFAAPLNLPDTADAGGAASADVPEPGTIALFGFGLVGFAAARRRAAARTSR